MPGEGACWKCGEEGITTPCMAMAGDCATADGGGEKRPMMSAFAASYERGAAPGEGAGGWEDSSSNMLGAAAAGGVEGMGKVVCGCC